MAVAVTVDQILGNPDVTQCEQFVQGTLVLSGNYGSGSSHGDTINLSNLRGMQSNSVPRKVEIYEAPPAGTSQSGYDLVFNPGTTQANGVIQVFGTTVAALSTFQAAYAEYPEGTSYAAALTGAVIKFRAWFPLGQ